MRVMVSLEGMPVSSSDNLFLDVGPELHFDTANQTLYFSATGATEIAVVQLQPGVTLHPHDVLILSLIHI